MLTDTHCHLDFDRFDEDRQAVLQRAEEAGVGRILNPAVDLAAARRAVALAEAHETVYAAVGLHPNSALEWSDELPAAFRTLAAHPKALAIGEIGLDYYWDKAPKDLQKRVFQAQLELAAEVGLPVVIHNREATEDVLAALLVWQRELVRAENPLAARPGVLHSFSADTAAAERAMAAHFFIGITGPVTFKNAPERQGLVAGLPLDRILIETDAPFLTPHPFRGQRNEPARVKRVAEKIAELKGLDPEAVIEATWENSRRLFGW